MIPILAILLLIPLGCSLIALIVDDKKSDIITIISTAAGLLIILMILSLYITTGYSHISEQYSYVQNYFGSSIALILTLNPIPLILLIMSYVVLFAAALAGEIENKRKKISSVLILIFQFAATGFFLSGSLFFFLVFWEIGIIALFFMIYLLGSSNRRGAAIKFLLYEIFASAMLLLGILIIFFYSPVHTFSITTLTASADMIPLGIKLVAFAALFIAFAINMPIVPFHSWLPDAHTEASTQGSMLLSGILTKFGAFGMIVLFSIIVLGGKSNLIVAVIAIISSLYAVFLTIRQQYIKRIVAYTTIVEMGIIMIGIASLNNYGTYGAVYAMLAHGISIALMFLLAGVIKHVFGEADIRLLKGIMDSRYTAYSFLIGVFAITGIPLTASFIGDILIFIGSFGAFGILGLLPLISIILLGAFLYFVISRSLFSREDHPQETHIDKRVIASYSVLLFFIILLGVFPSIILNLIH